MSEVKEEIVTEPVRQIICAKCGKPLDVAALAAFSKFRCGHCNAVQTVPAKFGNFVLLELLGRGGMGAVYRGVDQSLGRPVAIKVMLRSVAADRVFYEQFKREARAAAALNHPNIVQIYSLDEENGQAYIAMELLSGGRLDQLIASRKKLDEATALKIAIEVVEGLNAANRVGLIHDDIKPENIMFDAKGVSKVVDFGLARFRGKGPQAGQNEIWGTPYYIAPEKVLRKTPDFRSDIYSFGGTLFHALAGRPPFDGETAVDVVKARIQGPAPDLGKQRPDLRPEFAALIGRMLEREPEKRPATYADILAVLRKLAGVKGPPGTEDTPPRSTKILIKGKRRVTLSGASTPAAEDGGQAETPAAGRKPGRMILIVLGALLLLAGVAIAIGAAVRRHQARQTGEWRRAELVRVRTGIETAHAAILGATTGVLAGAEAMFFYDVETTNKLAEARGILTGMGENANLVTLPLLPSEADVARRVEGPATAIFDGVTNLEALCAEADGIAARAQAAENPAALEECQAGLDRLKAIGSELPRLAMAVEEARKTAFKVVDEARETTARAGEAREAGVKEAARLAADEAARKKREAEQAEQKRREAERFAKIEAERATVKEEWAACADRIRQNQFAEAADALQRALARLETEPGKADAKAAVDRCSLLREMKDFLTAAIQEKPLRWGWFSAAGQIDITGANEQGILVRGRAEPWTGVDARQMLKFTESYVKNEDAREKLGKRTWARMHLAAAVYCYLQGERAFRLARAYADLAVQYDSKNEAEVSRLMPDLPKGGI